MGAFDLVLGPMFMGAILNVFLYAIMVIQCYLYFSWYKSDKIWIKFVVAVLLLLDTLMCIFAIVMVYDYLVINFGVPEAIQYMNISVRPYPLLTGLTAMIVQIVFGWRIQIITESRWLCFTIYLFAVIQMLGALGTTIGGSIVGNFAGLERSSIKSVALVWLFGSVITDACITGALSWHLHRSRTGFPATDDLLTKIVRSTIQTGALTTSFAIATVISYLVWDTTTMHLAFGLPLAKLYNNSLLSSLNSRQGWGPSGRNAEDGLSQMANTIPVSHNTSKSGPSTLVMNDSYEMDSQRRHKGPDEGPLRVLVQHHVHSDATTSVEKGKPIL